MRRRKLDLAKTPESKKRIRRDPDTTRGLILDATEKLMTEEGYAAVSSRRIALELGLNAATVHYYYPTTDDVFIALHRRMTDRQLKQIEVVIASQEPLRAFWEFQSGWTQTALGVEFVAHWPEQLTPRDRRKPAFSSAPSERSLSIQRSSRLSPLRRSWWRLGACSQTRSG
jgi:AcrR family transcriptional regulator